MPRTNGKLKAAAARFHCGRSTQSLKIVPIALALVAARLFTPFCRGFTPANKFATVASTACRSLSFKLPPGVLPSRQFLVRHSNIASKACLNEAPVVAQRLPECQSIKERGMLSFLGCLVGCWPLGKNSPKGFVGIDRTEPLEATELATMNFPQRIFGLRYL